MEYLQNKPLISPLKAQAEITPVNSPSTYFKNGRHYLNQAMVLLFRPFRSDTHTTTAVPADGTLPQRIYALFPIYEPN